MIKYISHADHKIYDKVIINSEQIKNLIKEKNDLFRFCGFEDLDGFFLVEEKQLLLFSNGSFLGILKAACVTLTASHEVIPS